MTPHISQDRSIAAVAGLQHENITRRQLLRIGLTPEAIRHRVRTGRLFLVHPSVFSVGRPPKTPLERAAAAVLACGPGAALSHGSAMSLWGLDKRWHTPFEVVVPGDRRPAGITVHHGTTVAHRDLTTQLGIRVTTLARTLLDQTRKLSEQRLTRAVNDALHSRFMRPWELDDIVARNPLHPGARRLAPFVTTTRRGLTRSELEDRFLAFCRRYGLPEPLTNVRIGGYVADAYFPEQRLIVEIDSFEFHGDRQAFERDRNRDADTLLLGIATVRVTDERMTADPETEAARLRAILASRASGLD